jgi:hypothetical protein
MLEENGAATTNGPLTPVRGCDGCTLCCKVMGVQALAKPAGTWCKHCKTGVGCGIYETRPGDCSSFICGYLLLPELSEEWKPRVSRLIISTLISGNRINVYVDPARPDAWRRQPYYASLQAWSRRALAKAGQVVVRIGARCIVVLPDHAIDLGIVADDELIVVLNAGGANGSSHDVYAVKRSVWTETGFEAALGGTVPPPVAGAEGYRPGRRLD